VKRLHAIVEGRVQGVNFRSFVTREARKLNLTGWVRNQADGTVEVLAEGEDVALTHLVLSLEKGTPMSRVDEVQTSYSQPTGEFSEFVIRY